MAFSLARAALQHLSAERISAKICKVDEFEGQDEVEGAAAAAENEEDNVLVEVDGNVVIEFSAGWAGSWALLPSVGVAVDAEDGL